MSNASEDTRLTALEERVYWLQQDTLSPYQTLVLVAIQTVVPAYGVFALVSSSILWWQDGLAAALANVQLFVDLTVATLMGISVLLWVGMTLGKLLLR
jgi:hypothetical protein